MLLDALELALGDPGHDHAPAVFEECAGDRGAEAAGPSGDEDGAIAHSLHTSDVRARPYGLLRARTRPHRRTGSGPGPARARRRAAHAARRHAVAQALPRRPQRPARGHRARARDRGCASCARPAGPSTCAAATRSTRASEHRSRCTRSARPRRAPSPSPTSSTGRRTRPRRWSSRCASSSPPCRTRTCTRCSTACSGRAPPTWELYRRAPAAKLYHQAYVHGLLEHCLTVAQGVSAMASTFPGIDRDVAVTGALLHDIGKLEAYTADAAGHRPHRCRAPAGRDPAGLLPHPPRHRGPARASRPRPRRRCCTSSSATTARSSTAARWCPCTREAWLVHMIDNLGGKLGSFDRLEKGLAPGSAWTGSIAASAPAPTSGRSPPSPSAAPLRRRPGDRPGVRPDRSSVGASGRSRGCPPPPRALGTGHPGFRGGGRATSIMRPRERMQDRPRRADHREVMRLARPILAVLLLLLALAPAASAHDEAEPNHRDTPATSPARTSAARSRVAALARTLAPDLPQFLPTTWCGTRADRRRHRPRRLPGHAASDQGRLRLRAATRPTTSTAGGLAAGRRLAHRAVPGAADGRPARAALRHGHRVRPAVRRHPGRAPAQQPHATTPSTASTTSTPWPTRSRRLRPATTRATCSSWPRASPTTTDGVAASRRRSSPTSRPDAATSTTPAG